MKPHVQYHVTKKLTGLGDERYGLHVTELTRDETEELLSDVARIQRMRDGGRQNAEEFAEFVGEVDCPRDEGRAPWGLDIVFGVVATGLMLWVVSMLLIDYPCVGIFEMLKFCN